MKSTYHFRNKSLSSLCYVIPSLDCISINVHLNHRIVFYAKDTNDTDRTWPQKVLNQAFTLLDVFTA